MLAALVCDGHVLLEDVPGTAKTVLARAIAGIVDGASFAASSARPTCSRPTSPASPSSTSATATSSSGPGPVFANVLLVDEINRAMPKTQSALLEAMAEYQATIDGVTRELPKPFLVLATENPIEQEGTFPLPEAQLDRFLLRTALGYPGEEEELRIVEEQVERHPLERAPARALARRGERAARGGARRVHRPAAAALGDPARARDAGGRRRGHRRLRARLARARAVGARVGAALRSRVRDACGHRAALPPGRHAPHRLHAELRRDRA